MNETDIRLVEEKNAEPHKEKVKKGRYLCEEDRIVKAKRNHRNKRIRMMCITVVSILLVLIMGLGAMLCSKNDGFKGIWDLDGTTMYEFNGSGKGAMLLPSNEYMFTYTVDEENKTISIDFASEKANDYTYTYELLRNKLILSGGDGDNYLSYVFTKK